MNTLKYLITGEPKYIIRDQDKPPKKSSSFFCCTNDNSIKNDIDMNNKLEPGKHLKTRTPTQINQQFMINRKKK